MKHVLAIAVLALAGVLHAEDVPQYTDWGTPVPLGPAINTPYMDSCVSISKDGLTLFFSSTRHTLSTTSTDRDLYVSTRAGVDEPWGEPERLTMINSPVWDSCPALSLDEHWLYFTSLRPGGCGGHDVWVSHRRDRTNNLGWGPPVHLGCDIDGFLNSNVYDLFPTFFEDEAGRVLMYFGSDRAGNFDLYQSEMNADGTFGPATPLVELNSPAMEHSVTVRRDGLEIIFGSNRYQGVFRFFTSTRASTSEPWSAPVRITSLPGGSGRFAMSFDGRELYFSAPNGAAGTDIFVARRERVR